VAVHGWAASGDSLRSFGLAAGNCGGFLIPLVADGIDDVLAEGLQHHLFLGRVLGTVNQ
jgi:hypothetical protein